MAGRFARPDCLPTSTGNAHCAERICADGGWRVVPGLTAQQVCERAETSGTTLRRIEQGDAGLS